MGSNDAAILLNFVEDFRWLVLPSEDAGLRAGSRLSLDFQML